MTKFRQRIFHVCSILLLAACFGVVVCFAESGCNASPGVCAAGQARLLAQAAPERKNKYKEALFAGGCFWGVEEHFRTEPGVISTAVGYCGGTTENPTYETVCSGKTGHAETVRVEFDPRRIAYTRLLDIFWRSIDPCSVNRQGPDHGTQYRTAIFYEDDQQKAQALASKTKQQASHGCPIATEVAPAKTFWLAEDYHQQYLLKNDMVGCH